MDHEDRENRVMTKARRKEWRVIAEVDVDDESKTLYELQTPDDESKTLYELQTPDDDFNHEPCGRTVFTDRGEPLGFVTKGLTLDEVEVIVCEPLSGG